MNRRGFLGSILELGAAPAIVRADSLMRIVPRGALVLPPIVSGMVRRVWAYDIDTDRFLFQWSISEGVRQFGVSQMMTSFIDAPAQLCDHNRYDVPAIAQLRQMAADQGVRTLYRLPIPEGLPGEYV